MNDRRAQMIFAKGGGAITFTILASLLSPVSDEFRQEKLGEGMNDRRIQMIFR